MLILYAQHCLEMYFLAQIPYFTEFRCSDRYLSVKKIQTWTLKDLWLQVTWTCGSGSLQVFPQVNPQVTHKDLHPRHALATSLLEIRQNLYNLTILRLK